MYRGNKEREIHNGWLNFTIDRKHSLTRKTFEKRRFRPAKQLGQGEELAYIQRRNKTEEVRDVRSEKFKMARHPTSL